MNIKSGPAEKPALFLKSLTVLGRWILLSALTGGLCGLIGTAFHKAVDLVTEYRLTHSWVLWTLPLAGLLAVEIYRLLHTEGQNTNDVIRASRGEGEVSFRLLPSIFLASVLTHFAGGSAGREGAALQMGGSIGCQIGRLVKLDREDLRIAVMAGMAAFFTALFGTPLAATVFAIGLASVGLYYHAAFLPCFLAALSAWGVSLYLGVEPTRFAVAVPELTPAMLGRTGILAVLCALLSVFFCETIHRTEHGMAKLFPAPLIRAAAGGLLVLLLTRVTGTQDYNGAGMSVIRRAIEEGQTVPEAFLWKLIFTAVTLAAGFKGGEVVPSFFVGAAFGCLAGPILGIPAGFAAAVGMISVFCGATNCPMASIVLAAELFGAEGVLYYALACGLSYMFSGYSGLYAEQKILYDKFRIQSRQL